MFRVPASSLTFLAMTTIGAGCDVRHDADTSSDLPAYVDGLECIEGTDTSIPTTIEWTFAPAYRIDLENLCIVETKSTYAVLELDLRYWCEWTNPAAEDGSDRCTSTGDVPLLTTDGLCVRLETWCTDTAPLIGEDPAFVWDAKIRSLCGKYPPLPSCQ